MIKKLLFLFVIYFCIHCSIAAGKDNVIQKQSISTAIRIHSENIFINGRLLQPGRMIFVPTGKQIITFQGNILRSLITKTRLTAIKETADSLRFLTCLAFLSICAFTWGDVHITDFKTSYMLSVCKGSISLNTEPNTTYIVDVIKNHDKRPLLIVDHATISIPQYRLIEKRLMEKEMVCTDSEQSAIP